MLYCYLVNMANFSQTMIETLQKFLGKGYSILFNVIGIISIFLQFMIFQMSNKRKKYKSGVEI